MKFDAMSTVTSAQQTGADGAEAEQAVESDIERLRSELDGMVGELDRRRHELFDVRLQLRRHATLVTIAAAVTGAALIVAGAGWLSSRRRQANLLQRFQNLARVVNAMAREPDRVERKLLG